MKTIEELKIELTEIFERLHYINEKIEIENVVEFEQIIVFECIDKLLYDNKEKFNVIYSKNSKRFLTCDGEDYITFWENINNL